jgi:chloramphenicol 3-O phosphotransferase
VEIALAQARYVHAHGLYDIEVDATQGMPIKLAGQIKDFQERNPWPQAFRRLRSERVGLGKKEE